MDEKERLLRNIAHQLERIANALAPNPQARGGRHEQAQMPEHNWINVAQEMGVPLLCSVTYAHDAHDSCPGVPWILLKLHCSESVQHSYHRWIAEPKTPTYAHLAFCDGSARS